jgi:predicted SprT family Zn-dependent metalloprotease
VWNFETARLMHRHGDEWEQMQYVGDPTPDTHDVERRMLRADRIYRCTNCDEEIRVSASDSAG